MIVNYANFVESKNHGGSGKFTPDLGTAQTHRHGQSADFSFDSSVFDAWIDSQTLPVALPQISPLIVSSLGVHIEKRKQPRIFIESSEIVRPILDGTASSDRWRIVLAGAWFEGRHAIHARGCYTSFKAFVRQLHRCGSFSSITLIIGDSMADILSVEKERSADRALNRICGKASAYQLRMDIAWRRRYIESERDASDDDSRFAGRQILKPGETFAGERLWNRLMQHSAHADLQTLRRQWRQDTESVIICLSDCIGPRRLILAKGCTSSTSPLRCFGIPSRQSQSCCVGASPRCTSRPFVSQAHAATVNDTPDSCGNFHSARIVSILLRWAHNSPIGFA